MMEYGPTVRILRILVIVLVLISCSKNPSEIESIVLPTNRPSNPFNESTLATIPEINTPDKSNDLHTLPSECPSRGVILSIQPVSGFPGIIVYYKGSERTMMIAGGDEFSKKELSYVGPESELVGFSPDGQWLAFWDLPAKFRVISSTGEERTVIADPQPLIRLVPEGTGLKQISQVTWLNDQDVSFFVDNPREDDTRFSFAAFFDLFASDWVLLDSFSVEYFKSNGRAIPSPDLTRSFFVDRLPDGRPVLLLLNRTTQEILWMKVGVSNFSIIESVPLDYLVWSRDSSKAAFVDYKEGITNSIAIISREGDVIAEFPMDEMNGVSFVRWSPDGRYLALGITQTIALNPDFLVSSMIFIYDSESGKMNLSCPIPDSLKIEDISWIPNTPYIIYYAIESGGGSGRIILLDLVTGMANEIDQNVTRYGGWSEKFAVDALQ